MKSEFSDVNLCKLIEGGGAVLIFRKKCRPLPPFPFVNTRLSNKVFCIFHPPIFITTTPLPALSPLF